MNDRVEFGLESKYQMVVEAVRGRQMKPIHGLYFGVALQVLFILFDNVNDLVENAAPQNLLGLFGVLDGLAEYERFAVRLYFLSKQRGLRLEESKKRV